MNENKQKFPLTWNEKICVGLSFPVVLALCLVVLIVVAALFVAARIFDFFGFVNAVSYQLTFIDAAIKRRKKAKS